MRAQTVQRPVLLFSLISLLSGFAAGQHDTQALFLQPSLTAAEQAFSFQVLGYRWVCGTTFSHFSLNRNGNRLAHPSGEVMRRTRGGGK